MSIMTSYNLVNGIHTANSYDLCTTLARQEWGFEGIIMTDWGTTSGRSFDKADLKYGCSAASGCVFAGNDLTMPGSPEDIEDIVNAVGKAEGEVLYPLTLGRLQACAKRMINVIKDCSRYED